MTNTPTSAHINVPDTPAKFDWQDWLARHGASAAAGHELNSKYPLSWYPARETPVEETWEMDDGVRTVLELLEAEHPDCNIVRQLRAELERDVRECQTETEDLEQRLADTKKELAGVQLEKIAANKALSRHTDAVEEALEHLTKLGRAALDELFSRYKNRPLPPATDDLITWIEDELYGAIARGAKS